MTHRPAITSPLYSDHHLSPLLRARVREHGGRVRYCGDAPVLDECAAYPCPIPLEWCEENRWYVLSAPATQGTTPHA